MGYGWPDLGDPVLSQCDIDALAFVFAWALKARLRNRPTLVPTYVIRKRHGVGPNTHPDRVLYGYVARRVAPHSRGIDGFGSDGGAP